MNARVLATPFGPLYVQSDGQAIVASEFRARPGRFAHEPMDPLLKEAQTQVSAYFKRRLQRFDLPLRFDGTPFQNDVWRTVSHLAFGDVISYSDVARAFGHPLAHRGVAAAMACSPLDLFIPAHRVIGADGTIKGAASQSFRRKLLAFERTAIR